MKQVEALEIDVGPIHHIKGIGLRQNLIQDVYVMNLAIGNLNESGDGTAYVEQGCASSLRLFSRGTAPRETATNTGRWSWNPGRRWCCPDRLQWRLAHTLAEPDGSTPE